jgi:hypothetical protein
MRPQVRIVTLLLVVGSVALGLAALRSASEPWVGVVFGLTVAALLVASCKARYTRGPEGARWFGFALFGWAHLMAFEMGPGDGMALPTYRLTLAIMGLAGLRNATWSDHVYNLAFIAIMRSLLSLVAGLIGAAVVSIIYARRRTGPERRDQP